MDDRRAHFLTMVGDACTAAALAAIPVQLLLGDGRRVAGTPSAHAAPDGGEPVDDTGYASRLLIDGETAHLEDVVEFAIHTP